MSKITPVITALPFHTVPANYAPVGGAQHPFYFQKTQCVHDCPYGTITDDKHLPSFIVQVPFNKFTGQPQVSASTAMNFDILCADGTNITALEPKYRYDVLGFILSIPERIAIEGIPPTIGDKYYYDPGFGDIEILTWNGGGWNFSGNITPIENDLLNVVNDGFVYAWVYQDLGFTNNARNGKWVKTLNGMQLCDIGQVTYVIYNGFELQATGGGDIPCGMKQIRISFPSVFDAFDSPVFWSELVDVRDFEITNNEYHKLTIDNKCNLGNIPYEGTRFNQIYYFEKDCLVGEPEYVIDDTKEEDGLGNQKLIFNRTGKLFQLDTQWIPEYIVDFLQFATLHSDIRITFPFETSNVLAVTSQYQGERTIDNDSMTAESNWMEVGCYSQVLLKFSLEDDILKTACCQQLDKQGCVVSSFDIVDHLCYDEKDAVEAGPPSVGDCILIKPLSECPLCDPPDPTICGDWIEHPDEIACWTVDGTWEYRTPVENMIITITNPGPPTEWFWTQASGWKELNSLECPAVAQPYSIEVTGYVLSTIVSGYLYYKKASEITWNLWGIFTSQELAAGVDVTGVGGLSPCTIYDFKLLGLSNNCDYGEGAEIQCTTAADFTC